MLLLSTATLAIGCSGKRTRDVAPKDSAGATAAKTETGPTIKRSIDDVKRALTEWRWSQLDNGDYRGEWVVKDSTQCTITAMPAADGTIKRIELDTRGTETGADKTLRQYESVLVSALSSSPDSTIMKRRPSDSWEHEELTIFWMWISGAGSDARAYRIVIKPKR